MTTPYYITTAINYTNGPPHIGHAYEAVIADVIARYYRSIGHDVYFLTGTDEHGQKIATTAKRMNMTPQELCDSMVAKFKDLNQRLCISNDGFIRTTDPHHEDFCKELWTRCAHDIYLSEYEGWYDEKEETFVSDMKAKLSDYKNEIGDPLKRAKEPCYYFRLSKYKEQLIDHITNNPNFIIPTRYYSEVLDLLNDIDDLCISRTTCKWGVCVPDGFDQSHVMYVWFDALANYLSGIGGAESIYWPANTHIIGKDIVKFHSVYWPAFLWSAGIELPKSIVCHGFIHDSKGAKMSKSVGNVVDPFDMLDRYPVDSIRGYMCYDALLGMDLKYDEKRLIDFHNNIMGHNFGNLVKRTVHLLDKYKNESTSSSHDSNIEPPYNIETLKDTIHQHMSRYELKQALCVILKASADTNEWLTRLAPWKNADNRYMILRILDVAVQTLAKSLGPFMPSIDIKSKGVLFPSYQMLSNSL